MPSLSASGGPVTSSHWENSDVLFDGSVAVAVMNSPYSSVRRQNEVDGRVPAGVGIDGSGAEVRLALAIAPWIAFLVGEELQPEAAGAGRAVERPLDGGAAAVATAE